MSRSWKAPAALVWSAALIAALVAVACASSEEPPPATQPTATARPAQTTATPSQQASPAVVASPTQAAAGELPAPKAPAGTIVMAWNNIAPGPGINSAQAPEIMMGWGVTELFSASPRTIRPRRG